MFRSSERIPRFRVKPLKRTLPVGGRSWACPRDADGSIGGRARACPGETEEVAGGRTRDFAGGQTKTLKAGRSARAARVACDVACECWARPWRGTEAQEGIGHCSGCNSPVMVRIHRRSKALEAAKVREARFGVNWRTPRIDESLARWRNVKRAIPRRRVVGTWR